jgi:UDP-glucose:(heptosyl)LPS alpha-1,3-glucosyltransferase
MRPLRIAILLDKFLPSRGGERYFSFLADALAKRGHEVHIFATKVEEGDQGHVLPYRVHLIPVIGHLRSLRTLSFWRNSARILEKLDFDIVHGVAQSRAVNVLNPHGGVEMAYLKQEFASISSPYYHAYKFLKRYLSVRHYLEIGLQRRQYRTGRLSRVIAISTMIKRDVMAYYRFPDERIAVVFNSVDLDRFHPRTRDLHRQSKRSELAIDDQTLLLLFAGNNFRLKGVETLVRAVAALSRGFPERRFHLIVAGRGHAGKYRRLAERLGVGDRVTFLGAAKGMEAYYGAADIYVHPTFYDSCSLTVLEALASGLPVVTSRFNGASDAILSDEGGKVIDDPADADELAKAIAFYVDEERRKRAGKVAREWMERHTPERNVEETLEVYYEVVREKEGIVS